MLNPPRIDSRFVYICRPLTGVLYGTTPCLLLERDTARFREELDDSEVVWVVWVAWEYAGGLSSGVEPVEAYIHQRSKAKPLCCGTKMNVLAYDCHLRSPLRVDPEWCVRESCLGKRKSWMSSGMTKSMQRWALSSC